MSSVIHRLLQNLKKARPVDLFTENMFARETCHVLKSIFSFHFLLAALVNNITVIPSFLHQPSVKSSNLSCVSSSSSSYKIGFISIVNNLFLLQFEVADLVASGNFYILQCQSIFPHFSYLTHAYVTCTLSLFI